MDMFFLEGHSVNLILFEGMVEFKTEVVTYYVCFCCFSYTRSK